MATSNVAQRLSAGQDFDKAIKGEIGLEVAQGAGVTEYMKAVRAVEAQLGGRIKAKQPGALYNVSLDVEPEDLLDWDAPLSKQSEKVRKAVEGVMERAFASGHPIARAEQLAHMQSVEEGMKAQHVYRTLEQLLGSGQAASRALNEAGIPGLRYFDAGSRGKGEGSRNVVMFRDDLIKIEGVE